MYDAQICLERINILRKRKNNVTIEVMLKDANLNPSTIDNIRRNRKPSIDKLMEPADYFDCSIDYLVGRTDSPDMNRK